MQIFLLRKFFCFFLGGCCIKDVPKSGIPERAELKRAGGFAPGREKDVSLCPCWLSITQLNKERERSRRDIIVAKSVIVHNCTQTYLRLS